MNGCGHCEALKEDWNKAVDAVSQKHGGNVGKVDGYNTINGNGTHNVHVIDAQNDKAKSKLGKLYNGGKPFEIGGYPTIKRHENNKTVEYNGPRKQEALEHFIQGKLPMNGGKKRKSAKKNQNKKNRGTRKNRNGNWLTSLFY